MLITTIFPNDSLSSLADLYQTDASVIAYDNQIPPPYALAVGEAILLTDVTTPLRENDILVTPSDHAIFSGGYAYPFISHWVLEQTLPFLTDLFIFSYGFTETGELLPPAIDDSWMIALANAYDVAPILTLTPFGPDGRFSNTLISQILHNDTARATLISNLTQTVVEQGFEGVDIDFEYIFASDRLAFVAFVEEVANAIHPLGYPVSVALAPKTSDDQPGLLYEGKDYARLGEVSDFCLLMTYEWGYKYGPPMAVAPINNVRKVVEYALTRIPASKLHLGIPNYGYDWPLPFESGITAARTIGNVEAVQIAIAYSAEIQFSSTAQSPYFFYETQGIQHEVWFEDVRSIYQKFQLVQEYQLRGVSYWQIGQLFRGNWLLQSKTFPKNNATYPYL